MKEERHGLFDLGNYLLKQPVSEVEWVLEKAGWNKTQANLYLHKDEIGRPSRSINKAFFSLLAGTMSDVLGSSAESHGSKVYLTKKGYESLMEKAP